MDKQVPFCFKPSLATSSLLNGRVILVHVEGQGTLSCGVEHASVTVELVLAVLSALDVEVEVELLGQVVLVLQVVADVGLLPHKLLLADVALKLLQRLPPAL